MELLKKFKNGTSIFIIRPMIVVVVRKLLPQQHKLVVKEERNLRNPRNKKNLIL